MLKIQKCDFFVISKIDYLSSCCRYISMYDRQVSINFSNMTLNRQPRRTGSDPKFLLTAFNGQSRKINLSKISKKFAKNRFLSIFFSIFTVIKEVKRSF